MENNMKVVMFDDTEYKIHVLPPSRSIRLLAKLTRLVGKPMAQLAGAQDENDRAKLIPLAVEALTSQLDGETTLNLMKELMQAVFVNNSQVNFEQHFHGKLGLMVKLAKEVLEVNYSDFLDEISALMGE